MFFLLTCPTPMSTLFPYTTLFRSRIRFMGTGQDEVPEARHRRIGARALADLRVQDRKSTRLNSSHPSNSYAVFSLNNKTIMAPRQTRSMTPQRPPVGHSRAAS